MADRPKKKAASGTRNDSRKNGKKWKGGKSPEQRQREQDEKLGITPEMRAERNALKEARKRNHEQVARQLKAKADQDKAEVIARVQRWREAEQKRLEASAAAAKIARSMNA